MISEKQNGAARIRLCLTGIICVLILLLSIGAAQGRYRMAEATDVQFQVAQNQQIFLWSGDSEEATVFQSLTDWTATGTGNAMLSFQVSNGTTEENFCGDPLRFCVRIAATQGIQNPSEVHISLQINEKVYTAEPTQILEGSSRYKTFGPGWLYCFFDSNGAEATWELAEGKLSTVNAVLTVEGTGEYASLLRLEVTALQGV